MSYASLADLKSELGIAATTTTDDTLLRNKLDRATEGIRRATGRRFEAYTDTRYYESDAVDGYELIVGEDLLTVTSDITNGDTAGTAIASTEYWLIDRNEGPPYYAIRLKANSIYSWEVDPDYFITVTGTWGWSATPPADIEQACLRWASWLYHLKDSPVYETTIFPESGAMVIPRGLPQDIVDALKPYKRIV
jgi:hypothetical protein